MCCVNSPTTASTTSSQLGQIVSPDRPPSFSADCAPPLSDEGFDGGPPDRSSADSGEVVAGGGGAADHDNGISEFPAPIVDEFDGRAQAKRSRAEPGDAPDRLGELPDAILLAILSRLPLRDAARSTTLSSRWRRLFDQSLLDFNACQPFPPEGGRGCVWLVRAIDAILASGRAIPVRSFRFLMYGRGFTDHVPSVTAWFRVLATRGVREVDVNMFHMAWRLTLPPSLLQLASLETLSVCFCDLPNDAASQLQLPLLRRLHLSKVKSSQETLQAMLSHCPSLECAKLVNITGVDKICLRSKSLLRLYGGFGSLTELVVEDAPNLEELVGIRLLNSGAAVKIVFAPKLQVLGYLAKNVRPLVLHDTVFDGGIVQFRTLMCSVKTLAIQVSFSDKGHTIFVAQLLKCFPCLETLCVEPENRSVSHLVAFEAWDTTTSIQCIEHSVTKVVFENFGGHDCQWRFLHFLLGMARALKTIELYRLKGEDCDTTQVQLLFRSINRVYPGVQFLLFTACEPVNGLYLCHCCPGRCQNENRVSLL
ncbi:hypothetical protein QYE76_055471 [Lolium multiflorum]|uniref:F-box domain-containing protein n=1 Tax=Lolium multiflorum TaxID=4521 RepID=A0AAD8WLX1_LOLMU|nr:hypothetical protein QYE76_055471 [Lolium multiflorum]